MTDTRYRHQRVTDSLRDRITAGELPPGAFMPSERELAAQWGYTRETVRKALAALQREGLITGGPRRTVADPRPITLRCSAEETLTFIEDMVRGGHVVEPPEITVKNVGDTIVREVRRRVDREWHNWARWVFPRDVAQRTRLAYDTDIEMGSIRYLKEGLGWTVAQETPYYDFRAPGPEEIRLLNPPGWVIAEHRGGTMEHPDVEGTRRFRAVRILRADRTRLVP